MMYVVLSVGVLTFSALFMRRESRMLARIEEFEAHTSDVLTTG